MVVIHVKRVPKDEYSKEYDEFLHSAPSTANIGEVTEIVTKLQNMRVRLKWMVAAAKGLAKDSAPEGQRHILMGPAEAGERYLDLARCTEGKMESRVDEIEGIFRELQGAVMMVFPSECSGADCLRRLAAQMESEHSDEKTRSISHRLLSILDNGAVTENILQGPTLMWWTGKPLNKSWELSKYTGKNEKTKIVVKLTVEGSSAPPREPGLDAKTQTEMMAYWYKKQEEQKKLVEDDDISFGNSQWADPHGLKKQFLGLESIKTKPR